MEIGKGVVEECERRDVLRQSAGENLEFEETLNEVRIRLEDEYHKKHGGLGKKSAEVCYSTLLSPVILMVNNLHAISILPRLRVRPHSTIWSLQLPSTERLKIPLLNLTEATKNDPQDLETLDRVLKRLERSNINNITYINYIQEN